MSYLWIFLGSYLIAGACIYLSANSKNAIAATRLRELGADQTKIDAFHKQASPLPFLARPTLFFGTIAGGLASLLYWAVLS